MMRFASSRYLVFLLTAFMLQACSDSGSSVSTGTVSLSMTDAASNDYKAVYVTVKQVQVHKGGEDEGVWETVSSPGKSYNLLNLVNGVIEQLALSTLGTGTYTQMRLIVGDTADSGLNILDQHHPYANYFIDTSNQYHELKIPSGYQSGIKLVHEFAIIEGLTTELILDFDVEKSIVMAGNSGNWLLKPSIKVIGTVNKAIVSGIVINGAGTAIQGARVSAQRYDQEAREVTVCAATLTSDSGEYQMYLEPGLYTIVVYKDGYAPACSNLMTGSNEDYEQPFTLSASAMGTITCTITLAPGVQEQVVEAHFLKVSPVDETSLIEIRSLNASQTGSYSVDLPAGAYSVSATNGITTLPLQNTATGSAVSLNFAAN